MRLEAISVHTAARRYCMARSAYWLEQYDQLERKGETRFGMEYSKDARAMFPRCHVLQAVLTEVERLDPAALGTLTEARELILLACQIAENAFTTSPGEIEQRVMSQERTLFQQYITGLSERDLAAVEPLFYRRVLSKDEGEAIWKRLHSVWGFADRYWYPISGPEKPDGVEALDAPGFHESVPLLALRSLLADHGEKRVWELRESGPEYELDLSAFEQYYTGDEGYWCSARMDWVIYASHESTITIGGQWLIDAVKHLWPDWNARRSGGLWWL